MKNDYLKWGALLAALVATASAEYELARQVGFNQWVAAAVPGALDIYTVRAMRAHKDVLAAVTAMIGVNAASHLVTAGLLPVNVPLVVAVSAIAPLVLWRVHRLADEQPAPAEPIETDVLRTDSVATVERVPDVYPAIETAVPAVPVSSERGATESKEIVADLPPAEPSVLATEEPRTRPEVRAEYASQVQVGDVPDWTVPGDYADENGNPTEPDPLEAMGYGYAAEHFKGQLFDGHLPSIRDIKARLSVGQDRAKEIQEAFREALPKLAGSGVTS